MRASCKNIRFGGLALRVTAAVCAAVAAAGCIVNDIPYPVVECRITAIEAEGLSGEPTIDYASRRVTLPLLETTDIQNVLVTGVTLTEGAESSVTLIGRHDLRGPESVVLSLYQDYEWTLAAEQTIPRSFTVEGQVGAAVWNYSDRTVRAYTSVDDLSNVRITSLKLGPAGITRMSCAGVGSFDENADFDDDAFRYLRDFSDSNYHQVTVSCHDRSENWVLYVEHTDATVVFTRIDGWVRTAWFYAEGLSGTQLGFRYRRAGTDVWTEVAQSELTVDGGAFSTRVRGLEPGCEYEAVACSGDDESAVMRFTTEAELPLPNADFETWGKTGNLVCPYLSVDEQYWDTGNKGAATVGAVLTEGVSDPRPGSEGRTAASLTSKFAGFGTIGKFAAGNIFIGNYAETVGTNGKVNFGRPFTSRPVALRGWVKFVNGKIDNLGSHPTLTTDDVDEGQIYIALGTWTADKYGGTAESPVQVYSKDPNTFFNKNAEAIIGYGELVFDKPVDGWTEFTIPIEYKATNLKPTHLIIVCSASRWGDYFAGSTQNRMWLDDFELVWE